MGFRQDPCRRSQVDFPGAADKVNQMKPALLNAKPDRMRGLLMAGGMLPA